MTTSKIEWTDRVWNPVTGCTKVSEGCRHCYAERLAPKVFAGQLVPANARCQDAKGEHGGRPRRFTDVRCHPERLDAPLGWRKPRRVFVNSMSDLFHEDVPFEFIEQVFATMAWAERHTFQILTKRPTRMRAFLTWSRWGPRKLPNVWLGVSCENQKAADERILDLLLSPAAVRFVSAEPLLGPIDWGDYLLGDPRCDEIPRLDWVIVGGESGPRARPCEVRWVRRVVEDCAAAGVKCFVKQLGDNAGWSDPPPVMVTKKGADGVVRRVEATTPFGKVGGFHRLPFKAPKANYPAEWPEDLRVQEYPDRPV